MGRIIVTDDFGFVPGFGADLKIQQATQEVRPMGIRRIPSGSIVPALRALRPVYRVAPSTAGVASYAAVRARIQGGATRLLQAPAKVSAPLIQRAAKLAAPLKGFGGTTAEDEDYIRSLVEAIRRAMEESSLTDAQKVALGGELLASRAGQISGTLGLDFGFQDVANAAGGELVRLFGVSGAADPMAAIKGLLTDHLGGVFEAQGLGSDVLAALGRNMMEIYDRLPNVNDLVSDVAAMADGGLQRMVEELIGDSGAASWLTLENLERAGSAVMGWVGAAESGQASGYLRAAGETLALAGAVVPQPAGAAVSAAGGVVTLIGSLLGTENPPQPPEAVNCSVYGGSGGPWTYNPEAWVALAVSLCAKQGLEDCTYYKGSTWTTPVQARVAEDGWYATIDHVTGEVMVRRPPERATDNPPMIRLRDFVAFDELFPPDDPMRVVTFLQTRASNFALARWETGGDSRPGILWCIPDPTESFNRFIGSKTCDLSVYPIRNPNGPAQLFGGDSARAWSEIYSSSNWMAIYCAAVVTSAAFGTVPAGTTKTTEQWNSRRISTGVGGFPGKRQSISVIQSVRCGADKLWLAPCYDTRQGNRRIDQYLWVQYKDDGSAELMPVEEFARRASDQGWQKDNRAPLPSPEVQTSPGSAVLRPWGLTHPGVLYTIPPKLTITRVSNVGGAGGGGAGGGGTLLEKTDGKGMSMGTKLALGAVGLVVIGGVVYAVSRKRP